MTLPIGRRDALMLGAALVLPRTARAQVAPMEAAFAGWMAQHGITQGTMALALEGRLVQAAGFGGADAAARVPVWSLSKLVTALAIARLVGEGKLTLDSTLAQAMPTRLGRLGTGPLGALTVAQLLTHRSGMPREIAGENVPGLRALLRARAPRNLTTDMLVGEILSAAPTRPAGEAHVYSNLNYFLLGLVVEEASGQPYATYAGREVLGRVGIRAPAMNRDWALLGPIGGWSLSGAEYVALLLRGVAGDALIPPAVRAWMNSAEGKTITDGNAAFYALGQFARPISGGFNRWHAGAWSFRMPVWQVDVSAGTFAVLTATRAAWFVSFSPNPGTAQVAALDRALFAAHLLETAGGRADRLPEFVDAPAVAAHAR